MISVQTLRRSWSSAGHFQRAWCLALSFDSSTRLFNLMLMSYDKVTPLISATVNNKVASARGTQEPSRCEMPTAYCLRTLLLEEALA